FGVISCKDTDSMRVGRGASFGRLVGSLPCVKNVILGHLAISLGTTRARASFHGTYHDEGNRKFLTPLHKKRGWAPTPKCAKPTRLGDPVRDDSCGVRLHP